MAPSSDLDRLFRQGSRARKVAEILLSGAPVSRPDLADRAGVSPTTIPRVVSSLERAGYDVERTTDQLSRQARYRVVSDPSRMHPEDRINGDIKARFIYDGGGTIPVRVTGVEIGGGSATITYEAEALGTYRARLCGPEEEHVRVPACLLASSACLLAITIMESGRIGVEIGSSESSAFLCDVVPIDAPPYWPTGQSA